MRLLLCNCVIYAEWVDCTMRDFIFKDCVCKYFYLKKNPKKFNSNLLHSIHSTTRQWYCFRRLATKASSNCYLYICIIRAPSDSWRTIWSWRFNHVMSKVKTADRRQVLALFGAISLIMVIPLFMVETSQWRHLMEPGRGSLVWL